MIKQLTFVLLLFISISPQNNFAQALTLPLSKNVFVVIAHRGDHTQAPENTLAAFQNAIDNGVDYVEIDLRMSKDSQLVILHNATVDQMTDAKGRVKDFNLDSLRQMKVREKRHPEWGFHKIPTFKEVLQLCKEKVNIYLDFKDAPVALAYKEILETGMEHHIIVYINAKQQFTDWRKIAPQMPLMISLPKPIKTKADMFKLLDSIKIDILDGNFNEYTAETVAAAKEKNVPVWADIQGADENAEKWDKALATHLTGLQTDNPKALINYLKSKDKVLDLPINHFQFLGSHNSYKEYIDPKLIKLIEKMDTTSSLKGLEYHHVGLSEQLNLGLRALEIDIAADEKGGKYAHPKGLDWAGKSATRPYDTEGAMKEPGFKVLHVQDIDFRSNCLTFKKCLEELKQWSNAHPTHEPIFITLNAKDDTIKRAEFAVPEKFTAPVFDQMDKAILAYLGADKIITPDKIRGNYNTLEEAVLKNGWLKQSEAKGKFFFVLDENKEKTAYYIQNHPALKGRVLFTNSPVGTPEAAFLIMNDAIKDGEKIKENVKKGYFVRTRADADTREARTNDYSRFKAAQASGAQIISTDYYFKSTLFPSEYVVHFEEKTYFRKNPLF